MAVVGPTAAGKSELALALAERFGGEIVNADSRQVYRGMDAGTAKPSRDMRARLPHHLYDIVDPLERYSLARYRRDALAACEGVWARGGTPWLVGGTGQYVRALLEGWRVPEVPPNPALRAALQSLAGREGAEALHARLRALDPEGAARIDARNVRRVVRALEVRRATGEPIGASQMKDDPGFAWLALGVDREREQLVWRINRRTEAMFAGGLVEETRALLDGGLPPDASALSSIGYAEAVRELRGEITREKAIELTKRATKRLARRQRQWFRRQDPRIAWADGPEAAADAVAPFLRG